MRIIHYITDLQSHDSVNADEIKKMVLASSSVAECHLLTVMPLSYEILSELQQAGVSVHYTREASWKNPFANMSAKKSLKRLIADYKAELVHVHGAWDYSAAMMEKYARKLNMATVVSPHGKFTMDELNDEFFKKRVLPLLWYQLWMLRNCTCAVVTSEEEKKEIYSIVRKKRVNVVGADDVDYATVLGEVYRVAIDSTYHNRVDDSLKLFVRRMVRDSLLKNNPPAIIPKEKKSKKKSDEPESYDQSFVDTLDVRHLYLYAFDEDVTEVVREQMWEQGLVTSEFVDVENVTRYKNVKAKKRGSLEEVDKSPRKQRIPEENEVERHAALLIYKAYKTGFKKLTLRHETELFNLFRHTDFDEDIVGKELKRLGIKRFTKKLQKYMGKMYLLEKGYDIF